MCRLLGYQGLPIQLDQILSQPEHSLIVQSYKPREMAEAILNADGFGVGWYHSEQDTQPFIYKNIQPIWSDINLPHLSRYIQSGKILGYVRSATPGQGVNFNNCQPFQFKNLLFIHNGYIQNFRSSLYKLIRTRLSNKIYEFIDGTTDSEHIFALFLNELSSHNPPTLEVALKNTLNIVTELAKKNAVKALVNVIISDGHQMVASRFASGNIPPTLYCLQNDPNFPQSVIIASEPLFVGKWQACPEQSIIRVGENLDIHIEKLA
jgi:ergothioneine biosynthesis protein EgtC